MINTRMNKLLYPSWEIVLHTDFQTAKDYEPLFERSGIRVVICDPAPLCKAMLWRMKPCFEFENGQHKYSHVLCRDLDSPPTYREVQAVTYWMNRDKACHAITDSVSHDVPLLGGMIGFRPCYFTQHFPTTWDLFIQLGGDVDWKRKGTDQEFLSRVVYPVFGKKGTENITQHYVKGYGDTFLNDWHNSIPNIEVDIPYTLIESNEVCGHIGAAGFYEPPMFKFLRKHWDKFGAINEVEKLYPNIFWWSK